MVLNNKRKKALPFNCCVGLFRSVFCSKIFMKFYLGAHYVASGFTIGGLFFFLTYVLGFPDNRSRHV